MTNLVLSYAIAAWLPEYCQPYAYHTSHTHAWPGHLGGLSAAHCRPQWSASYCRSYGSPRCGGRDWDTVGDRMWLHQLDYHPMCLIICQLVHAVSAQPRRRMGWRYLVEQDLLVSAVSARSTLEKGDQTLCIVHKGLGKVHLQCDKMWIKVE